MREESNDTNATKTSNEKKQEETSKNANHQPTTSRKNMGRNARRRRQKVLAIEEAAAQAAVGNASSTSQASKILPQDRGYLWPAVENLCSLTKEDKHALIAQLGYLPGNALKVVARVQDYFDFLDCGSEPLVLQLYPLVLRDESDSTKSHRKRRRQEDAMINHPSSSEDSKKNPLVEPFPTMYWVTHPRFRALISKLELSGTDGDDKDVGSIRQFEQRLQQDEKSLELMKRAHAEYGQQRHDLITDEDWEYIRNRQWEGAFSKDRGVAGIRNTSRGIKCLHSHAAHYWSGCKDNVVGLWTSDQVERLLKEYGAPEEEP